MTSKRKAIGYVRVSRKGKRGGDNYITEDDQRDRILKAAADQGYEIIAWFSDVNESGKKWDRPGFQEALEMIERREASALIVARLSRFARSMSTMYRGLEKLEKAGGRFVAGDLQIDLTHSTGRMMLGMLATIAAWELELANEHWTEAKTRAVKRGVKIAKTAPVGYLWKENGERRLVPDPELAPAVVALFERRAAGSSWTELSDWFEAETGRRFDRQTLAHIIQNRSYLGEVHYGDLANLAAHEPLLSVEQFQAAQSARAPRAGRNGRDGALLTGLLVCESCGLPMTTSRTTSGKATYRCRGLTSHGRCPAPLSVLQELADPVVEAAFLEWARNEVEGTPAQEQELQVALDRVEAAKGELAAFAQAVSASRFPELLAAGQEVREQAILEAQTQVELLRSERRVEGLRVTAQQAWPELELPERRKLLAAGIESIVLHGAPSGSGRSTARGIPFEDRSTIHFRGR